MPCKLNLYLKRKIYKLKKLNKRQQESSLQRLVVLTNNLISNTRITKNAYLNSDSLNQSQSVYEKSC
ncbi:unnamed protein product [Paramecium sonneborni]|uniref:Uncharacterized protein n=1 Tax=Paramecium sonneborni TaxID=65129 RepID=A0A8S1PSH2_9CILI|nr:unnamed protein product [Paramecium sonneborni]